MKRLLKPCLAPFAALLTLAAMLLPAHAATVVNNVELQPEITVGEHTLALNGAGVRSKYFMKLYVGSLYSAKTGQSAEQIVGGETVNAVRLNITSGMITSERMVETIEEGFDTASGGNVAPLRARLDEFLAAFNKPIAEGDQFTLMAVPGVGLESYKNGEYLGLTKGDDFSSTLFAIWLGDKPADKKLKKKMLGE